MSSDRSSSAVRNLRSIFENKASESSPNPRGRSPGSLSTDLDGQRPRSKVRANFVAVVPTMSASALEEEQGSTIERVNSTGERRGSSSEGKSGSAIEDLKSSVHNEQERRNQNSTVSDRIAETAVESADNTPQRELPQASVGVEGTVPKSLPPKQDKPAKNPDKPVTGAEEEPASMQPADPTSEEAVSGGAALPPIAEDLRKIPDQKAVTSSKTPATKNKATKPAALSTKDASKTTPAALKSPASLPSQPKAPRNGLSKKASRSSLTAPTAASVARAAAADKTASVAHKDHPLSPKPKPRDVTKAANVSSHLTAPTAASRAKHESATPASLNGTVPIPSRPKTQTSSARPTPRTSLAGRPDSRGSQAQSRKVPAAVDGSFLERMTRPTAASTNKVHDKTEPKTPPRAKPVPSKPKTNGHTKATIPTTNAPGGIGAEGVTSAETPGDSSISHNETVASLDGVPPVKGVSAAAPDVGQPQAEEKGNGTLGPVAAGAESDAALESTPSNITGNDTIR